MTIHREGYRTIAISTLIFGLINAASFSFLSADFHWISLIIFFVTLFLLLFIISFFRLPARVHTIGEKNILCPADGKVVVIEEITDVEYFKDKRIQVSVFMSPANVHVNRNPMDGIVTYNQYHKGKYFRGSSSSFVSIISESNEIFSSFGCYNLRFLAISN